MVGYGPRGRKESETTEQLILYRSYYCFPKTRPPPPEASKPVGVPGVSSPLQMLGGILG